MRAIGERAITTTVALTTGVLSLALAGAPAAAGSNERAARPQTVAAPAVAAAQWHYAATYFSFSQCVTARDSYRAVGIWAECFLYDNGARYELWTWW